MPSFACWLAAVGCLSVAGLTNAQRPTQQAAPADAGIPADSAVVAVVRKTDGSNVQLLSAFCGVTGTAPGGSFQIEAGSVTRRGQYNVIEKYWPFELNADGICNVAPSAESMLGARPKPFLATVQLRLSRDDFGDPVIRITKAEAFPPTPVLWMKFYLRNLAQSQRTFFTKHNRYTSSTSRLRFNAREGVSDPIIIAGDQGWWAYVTNPAAADTVCAIASLVPNPLSGSTTSDVTCMSRAAYVAQGSRLPSSSIERAWPVGSVAALDSMTNIVPHTTASGTRSTWVANRGSFDKAAVRVPQTPSRVLGYIKESLVASKAKMLGENPEDLAIIGSRSQMLGIAEYWYYFSLLADSMTATNTTIQMQIVTYVGGKADTKNTKKLLDRLVADFQKDFPGTTVTPLPTATSSSASAESTGPTGAEAFLTATKSTLRNLVSAQESHFVDNRRYASDVARLNVSVPNGVTV